MEIHAEVATTEHSLQASVWQRGGRHTLLATGVDVRRLSTLKEFSSEPFPLCEVSWDLGQPRTQGPSLHIRTDHCQCGLVSDSPLPTRNRNRNRRACASTFPQDPSLRRQSFHTSDLQGQWVSGRVAWSSPSSHLIWLRRITLHLLITISHPGFPLKQLPGGSYFPEYTATLPCESLSGQRWWQSSDRKLRFPLWVEQQNFFGSEKSGHSPRISPLPHPTPLPFKTWLCPWLCCPIA